MKAKYVIGFVLLALLGGAWVGYTIKLDEKRMEYYETKCPIYEETDNGDYIIVGMEDC